MNQSYFIKHATTRLINCALFIGCICLMVTINSCNDDDTSAEKEVKSDTATLAAPGQEITVAGPKDVSVSLTDAYHIDFPANKFREFCLDNFSKFIFQPTIINASKSDAIFELTCYQIKRDGDIGDTLHLHPVEGSKTIPLPPGRAMFGNLELSIIQIKDIFGIQEIKDMPEKFSFSLYPSVDGQYLTYKIFLNDQAPGTEKNRVLNPCPPAKPALKYTQ